MDTSLDQILQYHPTERNHEHTVYKGFRSPTETSVIITTDTPHWFTQPTVHLSPRADLADNSPTGFEWGYLGSGPHQLALAILAHAAGDDEYAVHMAHSFTLDIIAHLPRTQWLIPASTVHSWMESNPAKPALHLPTGG